jgi:5S rRNA maturation endonuclease (ribonuclease M5)
MISADQIKQDHPLDSFLIKKGVKIVGSGRYKTTNHCPVKPHKPGHFCVSLDTNQGVWHCNDHDLGGSIIDWMMIEQGKPLKEILAQFDDKATPPPQPKGEIDTCYDYYDETGQFVYQVVRMKPKDFRQRRKGPDGKWIWNMGDTRRVLYNLPMILNPKTKFIWVVEGEKDAINLIKMGLCATTNVGGAKKWCEAYSECLKGKDIILCGDNDDAGRAHMKVVLESLAEKAHSIRQVNIPMPHKDVSDFLASFEKEEDRQNALGALAESAPVLSGGIELPILSMEELEAEYIEHLKLSKTRVLNLGNWLPTLGLKCRNVVPGEVVTILAATGVGKTCALQNLAKAANPLPTLLFEMELPGSLTFERFCAMSERIPCRTVEDDYVAGNRREWRQAGNIGHIFTCTRSKLTPEIIETLINKAELKMIDRPALVLIDYVQLIRGGGAKRYEVISDAAESLKIIAKSTKTIIVLASQLKRKDDDDLEVSLTDAKESGAIENSSGLVLGIWRPDRETLHMRILKNTKGRSDKKGEHIVCNFDGPTMVITERAEDRGKIDPQDLPPGSKPYVD